MCTAIRFKNGDTYMGRNLDYEFSYTEEIVITPRGYHFLLRNGQDYQTKYALTGVAYVVDSYPLYYDAANEAGLGMAGLNFVGLAHYNAPSEERTNITQFELIPWVLGQCRSVEEARKLLERVNITDLAFSAELPPSDLHWMLADQHESIVVESRAEGLFILDDPAEALTNNPKFEEQMFRLNDYQAVATKSLGNHFSDKLQLRDYSRGMGGMGLPGDLSSQSRFVRAAWATLNSQAPEEEMASVGQVFHILESVGQARGLCELEDGQFEVTIYSACCNLEKGIYYYTTYDNRQLTAVDMHKVDLNGTELVQFPFAAEQEVKYLN